MPVRILRIVRYRLRIMLRAAFLLLALATVGLALSVLQQEKQLSYKSYESSFKKTKEQISATLRHPAGQLALLNPPGDDGKPSQLHPVLLPFAALDFDDQQKVQQAVSMSGCLVQYGSSGTLCVGVGNNPWAGGFIYVAGSFDSGTLVAHEYGDPNFDQAHRVKVSVKLRGLAYEWIALFEPEPPLANAGIRGRLTGFKASDAGRLYTRPVKDFRGWIWQNPQCNEVGRDDANCARNAFFSLRLPVGVLQDALFNNRRPVWPPPDLQRIEVQVAVLPPGDAAPLLDSTAGSTARAFSLTDLRALLLPGESLQVNKLGSAAVLPVITLVGATDEAEESWRLITALIRRLPVDAYDKPLETREVVATPAGSYEIVLKGDVRSVSKSLSVVASRMVWFVGAMLLALLLAWLMVEIGIISRVKELITRADSVAKTVKGTGGLDKFDLSDLRGEDELGVLATCLHDLLRRVREDVEREGIRAEQERDMWHAVGHEIMSPLQSLIALHGAPGDQSHRYISRMQQAVRVLYGSASPSEAFQSSVLQVSEIEIDAFLYEVAANAPHVGISKVLYHGCGHAVMVRADAYSLEDVITHILRNADRHRTPGSAIMIELGVTETAATISIVNQGPRIDADLIGKIFEYGVSDQQDSGANGNRGQGLFVAKIYMAKMGGTITVQNRADGVGFLLGLLRSA